MTELEPRPDPPVLSRLAAEVSALRHEVRRLTRRLRSSRRKAGPEGGGKTPTALQRRILSALAGRALRPFALAAAVGGERERFLGREGLEGLQERGLVAFDGRLGFYRPDAPPPEPVGAPRTAP